MAPPGRARVESVPVEYIMSVVDQVTNDLINGNIGDMLLMNLLSIVNDLQVNGPIMETIYKDSLDRAFITFRKCSYDLRLNLLSRKLILFLIEIRAQNWQLTDNMSKYYKSEEYLQMRDSEFIATPALPLLPSPTIPVAPLLAPGETINTSGKFVKPTKIPGKNYFKDEVVIRNSDSGKVMGIKGRRVHMIEEMSETVISFQRVNPGAKERLVQITGPDEAHVNYARQLMGDTIRRNASPVPFRSEHVDIERVGGSSSSVNSSASDESTRPQVAGYGRSKLHHSLSTNDASLSPTVGQVPPAFVVPGTLVKAEIMQQASPPPQVAGRHKYSSRMMCLCAQSDICMKEPDDWKTVCPEALRKVPIPDNIKSCMIGNSIQNNSQKGVSGASVFKRSISAPNESQINNIFEISKFGESAAVEYQAVKSGLVESIQNQKCLSSSIGERDINPFLAKIPEEYRSYIQNSPDLTKSGADILAPSNSLQVTNLSLFDTEHQCHNIPIDHSSEAINNKNMPIEETLNHSNKASEHYPQTQSLRLSELGYYFMKDQKESNVQVSNDFHPPSPESSHNSNGRAIISSTFENPQTIKTTIPFRPPLTRGRSLHSTLPGPDQTPSNLHEVTTAISKAPSIIVPEKSSVAVPQVQPEIFTSHTIKVPKNVYLNLNLQTPTALAQAISEQVPVAQAKPLELCKSQFLHGNISSAMPIKSGQANTNYYKTSEVTISSPQLDPNKSSQQNLFFIPVEQPIPYVDPEILQITSSQLRSLTCAPYVQASISSIKSNSLDILCNLDGVPNDPLLGLSKLVLPSVQMPVPFIRCTSLEATMPQVSLESPKNDEIVTASLKPSTKAFRPTITNPRLQFLNRTLPE